MQRQVTPQINRIVITGLVQYAATAVRTYLFVGLALVRRKNHFKGQARQTHHFKGQQVRRRNRFKEPAEQKFEELVKQQVRQTYRCSELGLQTVIMEHSYQVGCKCSPITAFSCRWLRSSYQLVQISLKIHLSILVFVPFSFLYPNPFHLSAMTMWKAPKSKTGFRWNHPSDCC